MPLFSATFEENVGAAVPAPMSLSVETTNRLSESGSDRRVRFEQQTPLRKQLKAR